jgi:hypothetical protein
MGELQLYGMKVNNWQVGGLCAAENFAGINRYLPIDVREASPMTRQAPDTATPIKSKPREFPAAAAAAIICGPSLPASYSAE